MTVARTLLGFLLAASLASTTSGCGGGVSHGGAGLVSATGTVGPLQIDRSTPMQVQAFAGPADYIGAGALRPLVPEFASFIAFGYHCTRVASGGIPTTSFDKAAGATGDSHVQCETVYFVNQETGTLAGFVTDSPRFHTSGGVHPGTSLVESKRREHHYYLSDVPPALNEKTATAWLSLDASTSNPKRPSSRPGATIVALTLESNRHRIGLQFV